MVDFSTYQPPGVYVEEETPSLVSIGGVAPSVVALVGPSVGYRTATEAVTLVEEEPTTLRDLGILIGSGFVVSSSTGIEFDAADFTLVVEAGEDGDVGETADNITTIARTNGSTIADGETVYVSYRFVDAAYLKPIRADDLDEAAAFFGPALDLETNEILSPLTLAAKFAFDNGAATVILAATPGHGVVNSPGELTSAYSRLTTILDATIIIPLPVGIEGDEDTPGDAPSIGSGLLSFVESQAAQDRFMVGIVGLDTGVSIDPADMVDEYRSHRMMHAHPNKMLYHNGTTKATIEIGGFYLAAAYGGRLAGQPVAQPLTKRRMRGFSGIAASALSRMTLTRKNTWSSQGVAVTELTRQGSVLVRHGTSTDRSSVLSREISLVRARDAMVELIRDTLDNSGMIGSFIDDTTTIRIEGVINGILENAMNSDYIISWSDVKVRQTSMEPSIIEVKFRYRPAYPLNYILVSFSVNTETGDTETTFDTE